MNRDTRQRERATRLDRESGLSLVELLVGVALGLFVVAGASTMVAGQLSENRKLLLETQIQQDLRSAADVIVRELRRAGHWADAQRGVWHPATAGVEKNTYANFSPTGGAATSTVFSYRRAPGQTGPYGFRLTSGVIQTQLAAGGWQDLTDGRVLQVTAFNVTPRIVESDVIPCPKVCPDGTTDCWPTVSSRDVDVTITARSVTDASVVRTFNSTVRLRNDIVNFRNVGAPTQLCPP